MVSRCCVWVERFFTLKVHYFRTVPSTEEKIFSARISSGRRFSIRTVLASTYMSSAMLVCPVYRTWRLQVLYLPGGAEEHLQHFARAEDRSAQANTSRLKYL